MAFNLHEYATATKCFIYRQHDLMTFRPLSTYPPYISSVVPVQLKKLTVGTRSRVHMAPDGKRHFALD